MGTFYAGQASKGRVSLSQRSSHPPKSLPPTHHHLPFGSCGAKCETCDTNPKRACSGQHSFALFPASCTHSFAYPFYLLCLLGSPFMFIPFPSLAHSCVSANERGTVWILVRARLCVYRGVEGFLLISSHFAFIFADAAHSKNSRLSSFFLEARMRVDNDNNKAKTVSSTLAATKLLAINKGLLLGHVFRVIPR